MKSSQIDKYLTSIIISQKSTNQIAQQMVESWCGFCTLLSTSGTFRRPLGDFWRVFRHCRKQHSYNAKISRRLQIFVLWGLAGMWMIVAVMSLIVMSSCIKVSKQHNFDWVQ